MAMRPPSECPTSVQFLGLDEHDDHETRSGTCSMSVRCTSKTQSCNVDFVRLLLLLLVLLLLSLPLALLSDSGCCAAVLPCPLKSIKRHGTPSESLTDGAKVRTLRAFPMSPCRTTQKSPVLLLVLVLVLVVLLLVEEEAKSLGEG